MEPIPYFYDSINRNAIVVRPRKPFFDWVNKLDEDDTPISELEDNDIYLIRSMDSPEMIENWIKKNFDDIFINELNNWCTDESFWPTSRTYKMFKEWFYVAFHSMVLDLEEFPVTKD